MSKASKNTIVTVKRKPPKGGEVPPAPIDPAEYIASMEGLGNVLQAICHRGRAVGYAEYFHPCSAPPRSPCPETRRLNARAFRSGPDFGARVGALLLAAGKIDVNPDKTAKGGAR